MIKTLYIIALIVTLVTIFFSIIYFINQIIDRNIYKVY